MFRYRPKQIEIESTVWVNHFKKLPYSEQSEYFRERLDFFYDDGPYNDYFNASFTMNELLSSIRKLKLGKSSGPDGLFAEMFKYAIEHILEILLPLYNKILKLSWFPNNWSESILCPIFKAG